MYTLLAPRMRFDYTNKLHKYTAVGIRKPQ